MDSFLTKMHGFATEYALPPPPPPPEPCEARFIMDAYALFDVLWTVEQKHPPTAMIELRRARTIFNITLTGFV